MELRREQVAEYSLAGNATVTIASGDTGVHFTYKIVKSNKIDHLYFIRLLVGEDNEKDYRYVGCYYSDTQYFVPPKKWREGVFAEPASMRAIRYFLHRLYTKPDKLHVYSSECCARCGRKLTTPDSSTRLYGPECIKYVCK